MAKHLGSQGLKTVLEQIKKDYVKVSQIEELKTALTAAQLKVKVVTALPAVGEADQSTIYLVKATGTGTNNTHKEYILVPASSDGTRAAAFEELGNLDVDLSGYVKTGALKKVVIKLNGGSTEGTDQFTYDTTEAKEVNITPDGIGAVAKEDGKGLSSNDYTTTEKNKLAGIDEGANKTTVDTALSDTSTNPVQNKAVKAELDKKAVADDVTAALAGKVDKEDGKGLSSNDYTSDEKTKLAGIAEGATADSEIPVGEETDAAATDANYETASVWSLINGYLK